MKGAMMLETPRLVLRVDKVDNMMTGNLGSVSEDATLREAQQLPADLKHHHSDEAKQIVGSIVIDGHHLIEGQ